MVGMVYNDKEGQAYQMLQLAFALAADSDLSEMPLQDNKYVRLPFTKITKENLYDFLN